jgi:hypothetical protein
MQSAKDRLRSGRPDMLWFNGPPLWRILLQPQMGSRPVVVGEVLLQHPSQMLLTEHDHMIEAFPPDRTDHPLDVTVGLG